MDKEDLNKKGLQHESSLDMAVIYVCCKEDLNKKGLQRFVFDYDSRISSKRQRRPDEKGIATATCLPL